MGMIKYILLGSVVLLTACGAAGGGEAEATFADEDVGLFKEWNLEGSGVIKFYLQDREFDTNPVPFSMVPDVGQMCNGSLHIVGDHQSGTIEITAQNRPDALCVSQWFPQVLTYTNDGTTLTICEESGNCTLWH
jgi:hypothetical protein